MAAFLPGEAPWQKGAWWAIFNGVTKESECEAAAKQQQQLEGKVIVTMEERKVWNELMLGESRHLWVRHQESDMTELLSTADCKFNDQF